MAVNSIIMSGIAMLQLILLTLDEYNYTIWYISRGIESPVNCLLCLF